MPVVNTGRGRPLARRAVPPLAAAPSLGASQNTPQAELPGGGALMIGGPRHFPKT